MSTHSPAFLGNETVRQYLLGLVERDAAAGAFLFVGPDGIGKRTLARIFAQALQCQKPAQQACGTCASCRAWAHGVIADWTAVAPTDGVLTLDVVRPTERGETPGEETILHRIQRRPLIARRQVVFIDDADALTTAAANALLKTLEEPAGNTIFLLLVESPDRLPATILSRCATLFFQRVPRAAIEQWLQGTHGLERTRAAAVAHLAQGCPGRAWRLASDWPNTQILVETLQTVTSFLRRPADQPPFALTGVLLGPQRESTPAHLAHARLLLAAALHDSLHTAQRGSRTTNPATGSRAIDWPGLARHYRLLQTRLLRPGMARVAFDGFLNSLAYATI